MDALSRREDQLLMTEIRNQAFKACDTEVKAFAKYSETAWLGLAFGEGRKLFKAMRACMEREMSEERIEAAKAASLRERRAKGRYEDRMWKEKVEREREELRKQRVANQGGAPADDIAASDLPMAGMRLPISLADEQRRQAAAASPKPEERLV